MARFTVTASEILTGMAQFIEFAGNHPYLVSALVAMTLLVIFNEARLRAGGTSVSPADAVKLINKGAVVIDVRPEAQFETGHIVNARNMSLTRLGEDEAAVEKLRNKAVLVCCDTGASSAKVARLLLGKGVAQVANIQGGLVAWQSDGLPLARSDKSGHKDRKK